LKKSDPSYGKIKNDSFKHNPCGGVRMVRILIVEKNASF